MSDLSTREETLAVLMRPRCRIALGEPGEDGSGWRGATRLPLAKVGASGKAYGFSSPRTQVRALAGEEGLCVRFDCALESLGRVVATEPLEHAWVRIWPHNDPTESLRFQCDFKGLRAVTQVREMTGERSVGNVPDVWSASTPAEVEWTPCFGIQSGGWWVEMEIPWRSLGLRARPAVMGIAYGRQYATGRSPKVDHLAWPTDRPATALPVQLEPAEALLGTESAAPERVELGPVRFGMNRGRWIGGRGWPKGAALRVRTETAEGKVIEESRCRVGANGAAEFTYRLDRCADSYLDVFAAQRLVIEAVSAKGETLYSARLPFGRHLGVCVDEAYGEAGRPEPATRRDDMIERAARALPRLHRRDTNAGAPSDFCLADEGGRIVANLAAEDAWERLAALVEERSSTAEERMAVALALAGQKSVCNLILGPLFFNAAGQATYHSALHDKMGPLSLMRYGGGPAASCAQVLARLLRQVRDPRTGKGFVTRVLSLGRDGGPRRAARNDVFGQRAAPVGAVAVEYGGSSTLLDPSAMAIFPKGDGTLATVEEILTDGGLRAECAGRLSPVYAKIDAEELRREPANRTPTKGVFPELFADEDRPDRPFDPRERQVLRTLVTPPGGRAEAEGFLDAFGNPGVRDAAVRVEQEAAGLVVRVRVRGPALKDQTPRDAQEERAHLAIDVEHGHTRFAHFSISGAGERLFTRDTTSTIQTLNKHLSSDQTHCSAPVTDEGWSAEMKGTATGYEAVFRVSWETLQTPLPLAVGLNVWIEGRTPAYEQLFLAPPRYHLAGDAFNFADVYLGKAGVTVEEIDFGVPTYLENAGYATLRNGSDAAATVTVQAENRLTMRRCVTRCAPVQVRLAAGERKKVLFPYFVSSEEKMGGPQRILLSLREGRRETWRAAWGIGYCGPLSAYERFGGEVGAVRNPRPGAKGFMDRKIKWICSRIPNFARLTTRQGAPSDFFLRAEDGSAEFNLMKPGVMQEMADFVAGRFDNDLDRILGIWLFGHAPFLGRHMSFGHHVMVGVDPLSLIRGNFAGAGGNCGFHSRLFGGLACHLKLGGKFMPAHGSVGVWGHVISAIAVRGSKAIVDADVGHIFLTGDGRKIATLEDMRRDLSIVTTAGPGELGRYFHSDDGNIRLPRTMLGEKWAGSFPAGAPQD